MRKVLDVQPAKSDANQNYSTLSNASSREIELNFIQFESDLDEQVESDCSGTQILTREIVFFSSARPKR